MMCGIQCIEVGPPPDTILSMPPPPLPAFLLPNSAIASLTGNDSQPCFAAFMCETSPGVRQLSGVQFMELPGNGIDDTLLLIIISVCVGLILLGAVALFIFVKCKESQNDTYGDRSSKHPPIEKMCEPHISVDRPQDFIAGDILFPCPSNAQTLQHQMVKENRMLWATLTPHGTRHFVSTGEPAPTYDDHYEVVDYHANKIARIREATLKKIPTKSFDNSGFSDFEYEDPANLAEFYHDDHDSGYQEPQEVIGTLNRGTLRPVVSSPTRIEYPNIPPLNMHPHRSHNGTLTLNKKSTMNRRTSDASSVYNINN